MTLLWIISWNSPQIRVHLPPPSGGRVKSGAFFFYLYLAYTTYFEILFPLTCSTAYKIFYKKFSRFSQKMHHNAPTPQRSTVLRKSFSTLCSSCILLLVDSVSRAWLVHEHMFFLPWYFLFVLLQSNKRQIMTCNNIPIPIVSKTKYLKITYRGAFKKG